MEEDKIARGKGKLLDDFWRCATADFYFFLSVVESTWFHLKEVPVIVKLITQGLTGMRKVPPNPTWSEFCCEFNGFLSIFVLPLEKELYKIKFSLMPKQKC